MLTVGILWLLVIVCRRLPFSPWRFHGLYLDGREHTIPLPEGSKPSAKQWMASQLQMSTHENVLGDLKTMLRKQLYERQHVRWIISRILDVDWTNATAMTRWLVPKPCIIIIDHCESLVKHCYDTPALLDTIAYWHVDRHLSNCELLWGREILSVDSKG